MAGYDLVERIYERGGVERSQDPRQRPGQLELCEQCDTSSGVAGNCRSIAEDEPPAILARFVRDGREQLARRRIGERQQRQLVTPVEAGDDTRRPAAEPSGARVKQNRTRKAYGWTGVGPRFFRHRQSLRRAAA